jgi:hypothetical protein
MRILSESSATKKWCPWTRVGFEVATGIWVAENRKQDNPSPNWAQCLANDCIYWERVEYSRNDKEWKGGCSLGVGILTAKQNKGG